MGDPGGFSFCCPCIFWGKRDKFENGSKTEKEKPEGGVDPAAHGAQMEDRYYNNKSFQQPDVDPNDPQQQEAALAIQTKYRQFHAKKAVEEKRQEKAATKIQAGFRGFQDRKTVKNLREGGTEEPEPSVENEENQDDIDPNDREANAAAAKIQAGFRGHQARKEVEESEQQVESEAQEEGTEGQEGFDPNDPEVNNAAAKIQAGFRGMQTRKELKAKEDGNQDADQSEALQESADQSEDVDIDLNDPEVANAASKIQAGFRGMQDRKRVKELREGQTEDGDQMDEAKEGEEDKPAESNTSEINLEDPEVQAAATKIQASFRGYQTRKDITERRNTEGGTTEEAPSAESRQNYDDGFV